MSELGLRIYPDSCLRNKTKKVQVFTDDLRKYLRLMADIMYLNDGIGLSAPQVGLEESIFVIDTGDGLLSFINPVIIESSKEKSRMEEGCLSLQGVKINVLRSVRIKVSAEDEYGKSFTKDFEGLASKAIQHENDHLYGRLIIDHVNPIKRFVMRNFFKKALKSSEKTCEVICNARTKNTRSA